MASIKILLPPPQPGNPRPTRTKSQCLLLLLLLAAYTSATLNPLSSTPSSPPTLVLTAPKLTPIKHEPTEVKKRVLKDASPVSSPSPTKPPEKMMKGKSPQEEEEKPSEEEVKERNIKMEQWLNKID